VDRIFVKLAPEESLHDSSFSNAVKSIAEIMHYSTSNSLCAIECFGRSTVSSDGAALAAAVLKELCRGEPSPVVLFATHMGQILLDSLQSIQSHYALYHFASIEASNSSGEQTMVHLYKLQHGIPQRLGQNECRFLCKARPHLVARSANIMKLMSSQTNTTLSRHPKFSLIESLNLIEDLKTISEKHGAISFIQST
jgi:DNA mismatch repair protein MSH5